MADLLIEFFCEEIPARMQARAEADLARLVSAALQDAGLAWDRLEAFSGPRRMGLAISGLPLKTQAVREERKGPRTDAPEKAIEGFLRGAGLASIDQCEVREDKKGAFYIAMIETPGRDTADVLKTALPEIARSFPWPKSMKFGEGGKAQRWVRPLHRLICLLDGAVVPVEVFGLTASNLTEGHRIHGSGPFTVTGFADYAAQLKSNGVILTRAERRQSILDDARAVCAKAGLELIEDEGLLDEVTGLAEHPVAVMGDMDTGFLDLPPEVITLTMRTHQKYFAVRDPKTGALAPKFVTIANQTAPDGGAAIAAGNARVLSARLSDARHFWDLDRAKGLEAMAGELSKVTFHDKLGTVADKTARVAALARELAPAVGADPDLAELAAKLAKADLVSQMVYEFPELQGVMGRYLALADAHPTPTLPSRGGSKAEPGSPASAQTSIAPDAPNETGRSNSSPSPSGEGRGGGLLTGLTPDQRQQVADAIRDHYKPQGPSDAVPTAPVSAAVALADKLDTLVGFWAIDEKPTGSKDPFALRRAALGVIRILLEGSFRIPVRSKLPSILQRIAQSLSTKLESAEYAKLQEVVGVHFFDANKQAVLEEALKLQADLEGAEPILRLWKEEDSITHGLLSFFADRLKVHLKDEGIRHDVIDAVFALGDDDLVRVTKKSRALQAFIDTDDGAALLAGYRRAANILAAEEKKGFDLGAAVLEMLGAHPTPTLPSRGGSDAGPAAPNASTGGTISPPSPSGGEAAKSGPGDQTTGRTGGGITPDEQAALLIAIAKTATAPEERALISEIQAAEAVAGQALEAENFSGAMSALARLRAPVDAFFEAVVVNDKDPIVRRNRLVLLSRIRAAADAVADFSRLEG